MVAYLKTTEIETSLRSLVKNYAQECLDYGMIPKDFIELIKHNFYAKYVHYNQQEKVIEIGINENPYPSSTYPDISVYTFAVNNTTEWLMSSVKTNSFDMAFYADLINRRKGVNASEIVMI